MDVVLLLAIASLSNIACFVIGANVGQKVIKGESIKTPVVNPMKTYKEHQVHKEAEAQKNKIDIILRNIDSYNGTGDGQEEVR